MLKLIEDLKKKKKLPLELKQRVVHRHKGWQITSCTPADFHDF